MGRGLGRPSDRPVAVGAAASRGVGPRRHRPADPGVRAYTAALQAGDFADVEAFFRDEASGYGVTLEQPVRIRVSHAAKELPPALPDRPGWPKACRR